MLGNRNDSDELPCVFRWHGVEDPLGLAVDHEDLINKLLYGPRHGLNLERLHGYRNLYSARTNNGDRMLFTTIEKNKKRILMVCEFIPSHDYHKAKMFKPGVLENFREMHGERLTAETITDQNFVAISEEELNLPVHTRKASNNDKTKIQHRTKNVDFFLQKFVALDDKQLSAVKPVQYDDYKPTVVTGAAGSGKTCIAVALLAEKAERELNRSQREGNTFKPVLYVAESEELCKMVTRNWQLSPLAEKFQPEQIQIKSYQQVIRDVETALHKHVPTTLANETHFRAFINESITKALRNKQLKQCLGTDFLADINKMYKELRIISGYNTAEEYCDLAGTQSLLTNPSAKEWLFKEVLQYKKYLAGKQLIDFALYQPVAENCFSFIITDEAQDFSWGQLNALLRLAMKQKGYSQICFLEDEQQGLVDILSKLNYLKSLLEAKLGKMNPVELNVAYRCPRAIARVANAFLSIGSTLSDTKAKEMEVSPEIEHNGIVELFEGFHADLQRDLCVSPPPPGFAVITTEALKQTAQAIFGDVVYTIKEIKGLEFKHIVLYGLMSDEIVYRASKHWPTAKRKAFFAEAGERREFIPAFHALYTACTRATERLTIIEDNANSLHKLKDLLAELKLVIAKETAAELPKPTIKSAAEQSMEVMEQIRTFIHANQFAKAHSFGAAHKIPKAEIETMIADLTSIKDTKPVAVMTETAVVATNGPAKRSAKTSTHNATLHSNKKTREKVKNKGEYSKEDLEQLYNTKPPEKDRFIALMNHPKANYYLFQVPLFEDRECLFTLMFDNYAKRKIILGELPARFKTFLPFFTESVLCRKVKFTKDKELKNIPLFCMAEHPQIMQCMSENKKDVLKIWKLIDAEILTTPVESQDVRINGTCILSWIAFHDRSLVVLNHLRQLGKLVKLTPENFVEPFFPQEEAPTSIVGCLLNLRDPGYKLAAELIGDNKLLSSQIGIFRLHSFDYRDGSPAALELMNKSIYGRALLGALVNTNPQGVPNALLHLTDQQARQLHKLTRPRVKPVQQKLAEIDDISIKVATTMADSKRLATSDQRGSIRLKMQAIQYLRESLEELITTKPEAAYIYLFLLPIQDTNPSLDQQCWFFKLMHDDDTRALIYLLLSHEKFGPYLLQNMPVDALCSTTPNDLSVISPFIWLISSRERLKLLSTMIRPKSLFAYLIPLGILAKSISPERYITCELGKFYTSTEFPVTPVPSQPICFATLLLLTEEGRNIINTLIKNNRDTPRVFSPKFLLSTTLCVTAEKRMTPLLVELLRDEKYEHTLGAILTQYTQNHMSQLTEMLFASFLPEALDNKACYALLEAMLSHDKTIEFLQHHIKAYPEIAQCFNPIYFVSDQPFKESQMMKLATNTPQSELVKLMKSTPAGLRLFKAIQDIVLASLTNHAEVVAGNRSLLNL